MTAPKVLCTTWQIITKMQYKYEVSIIICLWHMENYQPNNKKIAHVYKWMLKTNNEYKIDWLDLKWRTKENYQAETIRFKEENGIGLNTHYTKKQKQ
jgi:hypothetical protein